MIATQQQDRSLSTDLIRIYLFDIGRIPLLEKSEEIIYGKQVQRMMTLLTEKEKLEQKLGLEPTLKAWAVAVGLSPEELTQTLQKGQQAKTKMIEANLRLVVSIAKKYQKRNMEFLDLIQEGSLGLERAVEKFDPTKGYKFSTYAYWWIRQAITRALADKSRAIRLPIHITEKINKINKTQRELASLLGRTATITEVASALALEPAKIREYLKTAQQPLSLDLRLGDSEDMLLVEIIEDDGVSPEDYAAQNSMHQDVQDMLKELNPREQEVLSLRFGLEDGKEWSLTKIAHRLKISRERVRQLQSRAITSLRYKHPHALREYLTGF